MRYILAGILVSVLATACASTPPTLTVSAAANMQAALTELGTQFQQQTGTQVTFNYGATGQLAQQIAQGAPVDLFVAADRKSVDDLATRGFILPDTVQVYARGQIVLYTRSTDTLQSLNDLTRPEIRRIAIANPGTAPYGLAAQQALQNAGVWTAVQPKIVIAENIQQTQQYADTGNVDTAIVARSLAIASQGHWTPIPQELYQPIDQALGVVKGAHDERGARAFAAYLTSAAGRQALTKYGYTIPNQPTTR